MADDRSTLVGDCRRWLLATWKPSVAFASSLGLIAVVADRHNRPVILLSAVLLLVSSVWLGYVVGRERKTSDYRVGRARIVVTVAIGVVSLLLMALSRLGTTFEALAFAGLGLLVVSLGAGVSEARHSRRWEHYRGPVILGMAFFGISLGLILFPTDPAFLFVVLAGVLLAELGTELHTEDRLRTQPMVNPWRQAAVGLALVVIAIGLLISWGAGPVGGLILAVVVAVGVWMAASDSDSLLIVVVIAAALIWASAPQGAAREPELEARAGVPYYLVLGDSYMSGEGGKSYYEGTNTTEPNADRTNKCRRASTAWAVGLAKSHVAQVPGRVLFLACSGAVAADIRVTSRIDPKTGLPHGPAELLAYQAEREKRGLTDPPAFVLLEVGGNDAGFGTIGKSCVGPGDCAELGNIFLATVGRLEAELDQTYRDVRAVVGPDVPVITVPYPIPVNPSRGCPDVFLTGNERQFVASLVQEINQVVKSASGRAGFHYLEPVESSLAADGLALCDGPNRGLNFLDWNPEAGGLWDSLTPTNWTHNSFHPNGRGHEAMLEAVRAWFVAHPDLRSTEPPDAGAPRVVPDMSSLFKFGVTRLCGAHPGESCDVKHNGWLYQQGVRLFGSVYLPLVLCLVGAWMFAMAPIRYANERNLSAVNVLRRIMRDLLGKPSG